MQRYDAMAEFNARRAAERMRLLYEHAGDELMHIAATTTFDASASGASFAFSKYPSIAQRAKDIIKRLYKDAVKIITTAEATAYELSTGKTAAVLDAVNTPREVTAALMAKSDRTAEALEAFQNRKIGGMNLSRRVWNYTTSFKREMELAVDVALEKGKTAAELSRDVRGLLREPNKLFRRVRDKYGNLTLSKAAEAYHSGRGVYRSSYKNAMRLAGTEINMAYRNADLQRYAAIPTIMGYRVVLSNNHTLNGEPFTDICDELAGDYPKDFKFVGWHPHCRCHVEPIMATPDQLSEYYKAVAAGNADDFKFTGHVTTLPPAMARYIDNNRDRFDNGEIKRPYFIADNFTNDWGRK